jgi:Spy/CpxP family protein refolding chaperone
MLCLVAGVILAVAGPSLAQVTNTPAPANPPAENRPQPPRGPVRFLEGFGPIFNVLTDEQRTSLEQALQAQRDQLRDTETKIREARRQMFATGLAGKFDEDAVRKQASALANLEADMNVLRVKALSQIKPPLTSEQIEQIKNAPPPGLAPGVRPLERPGRRRILLNENRDENNLPPKQ